MTNELAKQEKQSEIDIRANEYLKMLGFSYTAEEAKKFLEICQAFQLNPFKREIYGIKGWDKGKEALTIIVGYETYLKRAERMGKLDGYEKEADFDKDGNLVSATITIYRKDWSHPFKHTVYYKEFVRMKEGKPMAMWATMPVFMLQKVAIAQAFRLAFPDEMGGLPYIKEEIELEVETPLIPIATSAKPAVEMPQEKQAEKIIKGYDDLAAILNTCLNLDELQKEWKKHAKDIKALSEENYKQLLAQKEIMKANLTNILTPEK